ncbi:hypothetical protein V2S04_14735 [Microbacterium sp. OR21]|uniref:hypothetical protein n=1 Tax=Microbacterium sp. OR21 TaxID=3095346 RepID=UPI0039B67987
MSDQDQTNLSEQYRRHREPDQVPQARTTPNPAEDAGAAGTPDAIKEAASRRAAKEKLAQVRGRGVGWVRPTDLFAHGGGALSRRGIDVTAAGSRRLRTPIENGARWVGERARSLPPLSAFGRRGGTDRGQSRSGIGMR